MDNFKDKDILNRCDLKSEIETREYIDKLAAILNVKFPIRRPKAYVHTYGCQGNVSDSERIKGLLNACSYEFCSTPQEADLVLFNTCAIRAHAEDRVFGNVGALKPIKEKKPGLIIALCGCMMQQKHIEDRIKRSFPYVNIVFGTYAITKLPEMLYKIHAGAKHIFMTEETTAPVAEGLPVFRDRSYKAWLPVMYGCNNFCSYCIVPYVRGRERSRLPQEIIAEARQVIAAGAKDITLLGQNVNSYGKTLDEKMNFSALIREINKLEGDFIIRFMTSHPKDCSKELLDTMANCEKVAKHLHLPFQSGNNRILKEMNRGYTREQYLELIRYAKKVMPDLSITSDVIVGFPGETYEEFCDTLSLLKEAEYTSLFTFIFSAREGTKAALMDDPISYEEKTSWFKELTDLQESIAAKRTAQMENQVYRILVEERDEAKNLLCGRTQGNISILFDGSDSLIGTFQNVKVTKAMTWVLYGSLY